MLMKFNIQKPLKITIFVQFSQPFHNRVINHVPLKHVYCQIIALAN